MYEHKVKWCPICSQGWVEIVKDIRTGIVFCCCSECENEWNDPSDITQKSCNTTSQHGQICDVDDSEIQKMDWEKYII
ncbi:MAG: hypothetical protein J6K43_05835 [Lachnospiraceae bacterium]|nr:hypothetical protein [Lachnospiraceae bacterium]